MQIKNITLYGEGGKTRILPFKLGQVNIITGESKTGKTAIIDIIDYCLGSKSCNISEGVIREHTEWFAITLSFKNEEVFIARRNPNKIRVQTTTKLFFLQGNQISTPLISDIEENTHIDFLKQFLAGKIGINEYKHKVDGKTRDDLVATFSHSRFYCFQPQDLIAQRSHLFYNQNSKNGGFVTQAIKDTLPYFLGAIREDSLRIEQEIARKKKLLRKLYREYRSVVKVEQEGINKIYDLIEEAKELDIIDLDIAIEDDKKAINVLSKILQNTEDKLLKKASGSNDVLNGLIRQRRNLKAKLAKVKNDLFAASSFAKEAQGYSKEALEQEQRLLSIELYKDVGQGKNWNSLLGIESEYISPTIEQINEALLSLRNNLQNTTREQPKLRNYISQLEDKKVEIEEEIKNVSNRINLIYKQQEEAKKVKDLNFQKGKLTGKIDLFLESRNISQNYSKLKVRIDELEDEIEALGNLVSKDEKEERIASILNKINLQMSNWSSMLDIEYQGSPIRFDLKKMTLFADTIKRPIPLERMGSGANWIAYHLLIHFGLHQHFIQQKRPVPNFLVLDQPSQAYYPPEPEQDKELKELLEKLQSSDEIAVQKMFNFIFNVTKSMEGKLQVIITDHARLRYEEFENSIIEVWRKGVKLIPSDWYEQGN
jgi:hypothetical protein